MAACAEEGLDSSENETRCLTDRDEIDAFLRSLSKLLLDCVLSIFNLPFPVVGSLNGVHMFAKSHSCTLNTTLSTDAKVVWKEFKESITLIITVTGILDNETQLLKLLETVFDVMVLLVGLDNIVGITNVERLKRDLKICYAMIDALLVQLTRPQSSISLIGDVARCIDCIVCPQSTSLQPYLDNFVAAADSSYGCIMVHGEVAVATRDWWALDGRESSLLLFFLNSAPKVTCRDVPVFLPVGSPTVAHRLLVFQLVQDVNVCILCGPLPSLTHMENEVAKSWKGAYEMLKSATDCHPRNFLSNVQLDKNILGFILVTLKDNKSLCSLHVSPEESGNGLAKENNRLEVLRYFYKITINTTFSDTMESEEATKDASVSNECFLRHSCMESYQCTETYKLYALRTDHHQIFILFSPTMPIFALRGVSSKTLQILTKGKITRI